ncbi:lactate utilization protein C [Planomonospora corallina]|uniref:Lactate utilization protein C n=1 Tax=Planomonospora corallina TaxID=1806052 RepID=A0ABV8I3Y1_9ACTN
MNAREEILGRIRRALADVPETERPEDVPVPRRYSTGGTPPPGSAEAVALLTDRLVDYRAAVRTAGPGEVAGAVAEALSGALAARGAGGVVVPEGFPAEWRAWPASVRVLHDDPPLPVDELDAVAGVVTTAAVAVAATGTLVLDCGPGQGRRALTLVPDYHLCVVRAEQVVFSLPEGLARLDPSRPLTFVSGPSATSDIELRRVEGVHGPRTLEVLIVV